VAEDGSAEEHLRHAIEHGEYIGEGHRIRKNGELFLARVVLTALHRDGRLVGLSKITQDLTLERERERALEDAMRAAQAASVAKSQFLANTSHEIRTPLNAVIGYAELLDVGLAGTLNAQQRQYVGRIRSTSNHLLSLINDVLDLSRIEAGQMRTASEPGLVSDAVTAAIQLVEPQVLSRGVALANGCIAPSELTYRGDPERVRQILVNLISNAVRFTEPGGRVTLTCGAAPETPFAVIPGGPSAGWIFVRVEDTGVGIAPDQLGKIWDAFVQVDASRTRKTGGSGLGLTISRHLANLMGGDISVHSTPGLGSSFVLWLPAAEPGTAVREAAADQRAAGDPMRATERRDSPEAVLAEVGGSSSQGLSAMSHALLGDVERIVATHAARLRADPETPAARKHSDAELEDHLVTFLADVAQCLTMAGEDGPAAKLMLRDGSAIQQIIARRHGVQRAALGWSEPELRREQRVLRDELHAAVGRHAGRAGDGDTERALGVINHLLDAAEAATLEAFRDAVGARQS
jgi:signal transduction histidine kinase